MSYLKRQGGVTLVELVIVLAITGAAIASAIAIRSSLRQDISFSTSIEQVKNQIVAAKNESIQTVKSGDDGSGASEAEVFGKIVEFVPYAGADENKSMVVSTLVKKGDTMAKCDTNVVGYKDQVEYLGDKKRAVIFQRDPDLTFVAPPDYNESGQDASICAGLVFGDGGIPNYGSQDSDNDGLPDTIDQCDYDRAPGSPTGCSTPPPSSTPSGCDASGYVCGLYGKFYSVIAQQNADSSFQPVPNANFISAFNGEGFGETYANTSTYTPILRYKTGKNPATLVSAIWTGQIRIPSGATRQFCLDTDDGAYMRIDSTSAPNNYTDMDQSADRCHGGFANADVNDLWVDITIAYPQRDTTELTPFIKLYYKNGPINTYVPINDLRTIPGAVKYPSSVIPNGLRGEYFDNNNFSGDPFSAYIDDNPSSIPYREMMSGFESTLRQRTGYNPSDTPFYASAKWTGQINTTVENHPLCVEYSSGSVKVMISGTQAIDVPMGSPMGQKCFNAGEGTGWKNITIEYKKPSQSGFRGFGIIDLLSGRPQLRTSADFRDLTDKSLPGSNIDLLPNQCSQLDDSKYVSYSSSGLSPGSSYKLDINYRMDDIFGLYYNSTASACIKLNGQLINGGAAYSLPFSSSNDWAVRTKTINNITIPSNGSMDLKIGLLSEYCGFGICVVDGSIDSVTLYRSFDSNGNLTVEPEILEKKPSEKLLSSILKRLSSPAGAQAVCGGSTPECSIFKPDNYSVSSTGDFSFYPDEVELEFGWDGATQKGKLKIDPQTNSVTREIDL